MKAVIRERGGVVQDVTLYGSSGDVWSWGTTVRAIAVDVDATMSCTIASIVASTISSSATGPPSTTSPTYVYARSSVIALRCQQIK